MMKRFLIIVLLSFSINATSQLQVDLLAGINIDNDYTQFGADINFKILPKLSLGAQGIFTPFDANDDYNLMLNTKFHSKNLSLVAGVVFGKLDYYDMSKCPISNELEPEPFLGLEYKFLRNKNTKLYYNYSKSINSIGIKIPIIYSKKKTKDLKPNYKASAKHNKLLDKIIKEEVQDSVTDTIIPKSISNKKDEKSLDQDVIKIIDKKNKLENNRINAQNKMIENETTEYVNDKKDSLKPIIADKSSEFFLIAGSFKILLNAEKKLDELLELGYNLSFIMKEDNGLFRVVYKKLNSREEAKSEMQLILKEDFEVWILVKD